MKRFYFMFVLLCTIGFWAVNNRAEEVIVNKTEDNLDVFTLAEVPESAIKVNVGQEFFVRLKSNITAGYCWGLAQPADKDRLEFLGKIDEADEDEDDSPGERLLGAPGFETLKFKALAAGKTVILLNWSRPWEKGIEPTKKHKINVTVE